MNFDVYRSLDLEVASFLPRSYLYQLPPIGVDTPLVENLSSYVTRLAESHCIYVHLLITEAIKPKLNDIFLKNKTSRDLKPFFNRSRALNSHGTIASDFVQALEMLTCNSNLEYLTLLAWQNVLSERGLMRQTKAWCPLCYQEQLLLEKGIYDPLIWTFNDVYVCSIHQCSLETLCPHCHQEIPWLSWKTRVGYCSKCQSWLGQSSEKFKHFIDVSDWDNWINNNIGNLLSIASTLTDLPPQTSVQLAICSLIHQVSKGNVAGFAKLLKIPKNTVWGWYRGQVTPSFQTLLKISYYFKISLSDLFLNQSFDCSTNLTENSFPEHLFTKSTRNSANYYDLKQIENTLLVNLAQPPESILTLKQIADHLGVNRRLITRHFPNLCSSLVKKCRQHQKTCYEQRLKDCCAEIRQVTQMLYDKGEYPTEEKVTQLLSHPSYLRYKAVREAFNQAQQQLGRKDDQL